MNKSSITPIRVLQWIAGILMVLMLSMLAQIFWLFYIPFVMLLVLIALRWVGTRKIVSGSGILLLLALPMYYFVSSFIHYGAIHVYDQNDTATLIAFIGCAAGFLGSLINIGIGIWQVKNKSIASERPDIASLTDTHKEPTITGKDRQKHHRTDRVQIEADRNIRNTKGTAVLRG